MKSYSQDDTSRYGLTLGRMVIVIANVGTAITSIFITKRIYYNWYIDKFGLERWKRLNREYYTNPKIPTDKELRILLEQLKTNYDYLNY
jgi:hypothetical protein